MQSTNEDSVDAMNSVSSVYTDSKDGSSINPVQNTNVVVQDQHKRDPKKPLRPKSRVVSSRYKQAANEVSQKAGSTSSSISNLDSTFQKHKGRNKLSTKPAEKGITTTQGVPVSNWLQSDADTPVIFKPNLKKSNPKLHSTALNSTLFSDRTQVGSTDLFSTTVVDDQKVFHSGSTHASLAELPNISKIGPSATPRFKELENTVVFASKDDKVLAGNSDKDYTTDELTAEYLKYLSWAYVDVRSKSAFQKQVSEAEKQLLFLTDLIDEEEQKLAEEKRKVQMFDHYEKVSQAYDLLEDKTKKLNEGTMPSKNAIANLADNLDARMNQIKLKNIYTPTDEAAYEKEFVRSLEENSNLLNAINSDLEPQTKKVEAFSNLLDGLNEEIDTLEPCLMQKENAASLAVQESSLKIALKSLDKPAEMRLSSED